MAELGKAYIEVRADLAKFPKELREKLIAALKEAIKGVEFKDLEDKAEEAGGRAAEAAGRGFAKKGKTAFEKGAKEAGKSLLGRLIGFFDSRRSNDRSSLFGSIGSAISGGIADGLKQAQSLAQGVGQIGSQIGGTLFGGGGDIMGGLKVAALVAAIPLVLGLAGAVVQLSAALFALPAAIGGVIAIAAPLMIALQGIGEAVGAGLSGDTEAFNAALKGLPPSARNVVKELVALGPAFKSIKANVQGAFFVPLQGAFRELGKTLLPVVNTGLTQIASSLGHVGRELLNVFSAPENVKTFAALFASMNRIVQMLEPTLGNLAQSFLNLIQPALPFLERGMAAFQGIAAQIEEFTRRIATDGTLSGWLSNAADTAKGLWDLLKEAGKLIFTVLGSLGDEGTDTIKGLADAFKELNAFFKSKEGQEWLHNVGVLAHWVGNALVWMVKNLAGSFVLLNLTFDAVRWLAKALESLGGAVWTAIKAIGRFFAAIGGWLVDAGKAIGRFFTETIPRWFGQLVDWFKALPGRIVGALQDLGRAIQQWALDMAANFLRGVGVVIGLMLALPGQVWEALKALPGILANAWTTAWEWAKNAIKTGWETVLAFFMGIPGALAAAGTAIWQWASDLWTSVWDTTTSTIESGWNRAWEFIQSIPGRIAGLGPKILEAARGIGRRIGDGLSEIGNFATDLGKKVTNALKGSINWVIDRINEGIAAVDEKIPGGLPRIPKLARGAVIDRPTLALIGEAGREVVLPLNDPRRAQELAEESGLFNLLKAGRPSNAVNVVVYLDPSGVMIPITRTVVGDVLDEQGQELAYGTRPA